MSRPPTLMGGGSAHVPGTSSLVNSICKIVEIVKRFSAMVLHFSAWVTWWRAFKMLIFADSDFGVAFFLAFLS